MISNTLFFQENINSCDHDVTTTMPPVTTPNTAQPSPEATTTDTHTTSTQTTMGTSTPSLTTMTTTALYTTASTTSTTAAMYTTAAATTAPPAVMSCDHVVCENGGSCRNRVTPGGAIKYHCDCKLHFTGNLCQDGR